MRPPEPKARKAVATIDSQMHHLVHIVDDLLDVTRAAHGKMALRRKRLELTVLARHAMEDRRAEFRGKGIELESRLGDESLWIDADGTRIGQVIGNLHVNAAKFTPTGGRVVVRPTRVSSP